MVENLQQIADELKDFTGKVRGEAFRARLEYIRKKEEGVKSLQKKMNDLGVETTTSLSRKLNVYTKEMSVTSTK